MERRVVGAVEGFVEGYVVISWGQLLASEFSRAGSVTTCLQRQFWPQMVLLLAT